MCHFPGAVMLMLIGVPVPRCPLQGLGSPVLCWGSLLLQEAPGARSITLVPPLLFPLCLWGPWGWVL